MPETMPEELAPNWSIGSPLTSSIGGRLQPIIRKINFADAVLLLYAMAFVRQYLWLVSNSTLAWILTSLVSLVIWYFHLASKPAETEANRIPRAFWPIVALPVLVLYSMRVAFPDGSFDQLNYHLLSSERALRGLPFSSRDFFPAPFQLNPASDMITGIARYVLGYRLGTVTNCFAILWAGTVIYKILGRYIGNPLLRCAGILLIVLNEQVLFVITTYMVDLLALPLLLEATYLIIRNGEEEANNANNKGRLIRIAVFLGAAVALKLTNLAFVVPLVGVYAYRSMAAGTLKPANAALFILALVAPLVPFSVFIYWQTQSPIFPFYNQTFQSPYWPLMNWADIRWGPKTLWETLFWPVVVLFRPQRSSELAVHSGRLCVAFIAAILGLAFRRAEKSTRILSLLVLFGIALWTLNTGYVRYALYVELLGGVVLLRLTYQFWSSSIRYSRSTKLVLVSSVWVLLAGQSFLAVRYASRVEWGMRTTYFHDETAFLNESEYLLRDHSFLKFLAPRERKLLSEVDVWVESNFITSGLETLSQKNAPIVLVCFPYYFETKASLDRFSKAMADAAGKRVYTLVFAKDLNPSLDMLYFRGLEMGKFTPVTIPFYSDHNRFDMILIEILPPGKGIKRENIKMSRAEADLSAQAFKAEIVADPHFVLKAGRLETIYVTIKNVSETTWPALGQADGKQKVVLGNHWLDETGRMIIQDDNRASLIYDLQPGQQIELPLTIRPPLTPGRYVVELDMVQERVAWFGSRGSKTLKINVLVEP
jgi:hypothetical protein